MRRPAVRFRSAPPFPSGMVRRTELLPADNREGQRLLGRLGRRPRSLSSTIPFGNGPPNRVTSRGQSRRPAVARAAWPPPSITQLHHSLREWSAEPGYFPRTIEKASGCSGGLAAALDHSAPPFLQEWVPNRS